MNVNGHELGEDGFYDGPRNNTEHIKDSKIVSKSDAESSKQESVVEPSVVCTQSQNTVSNGFLTSTRVAVKVISH